MEREISFGGQELRNVIGVLYNGGNILLRPFADSETIVIGNKPLQAFQTPQENALFFSCQLVHQVWVINTIRRFILRRDHDLPAKEPVRPIVQCGEGTISETKKPDIKECLIALLMFPFNIHLTFGSDDRFDIVRFGQCAHIHIVIHHKKPVFQIRPGKVIFFDLLDTGGIHIDSKKRSHD